MKLVKVQVAVAIPRVVELVAIRDLGDQGARILGQRMEEEAVDDDAGGLWRVSVLSAGCNSRPSVVSYPEIF